MVSAFPAPLPPARSLPSRQELAVFAKPGAPSLGSPGVVQSDPNEPQL